MKATLCPVCKRPIPYGWRTAFGPYDAASALLNHIESAHPAEALVMGL